MFQQRTWEKNINGGYVVIIFLFSRERDNSLRNELYGGGHKRHVNSL